MHRDEHEHAWTVAKINVVGTVPDRHHRLHGEEAHAYEGVEGHGPNMAVRVVVVGKGLLRALVAADVPARTGDALRVKVNNGQVEERKQQEEADVECHHDADHAVRLGVHDRMKPVGRIEFAPKFRGDDSVNVEATSRLAKIVCPIHEAAALPFADLHLADRQCVFSQANAQVGHRRPKRLNCCEPAAPMRPGHDDDEIINETTVRDSGSLGDFWESDQSGREDRDRTMS